MSRRSFQPILIIVALLGAMLSPLASPGALADGGTGKCYTVTGVVNSAATGNPIAGATVKIASIGESTTTGEDGTFQIDCVSSGNYQIATSASGFASRTDPLTVNGADAHISIALAPFSSCSEGENGPITLVLTWGTTISDLDSHIFTPTGSHVFFDAEQGTPSQDYASLDVDDVTYEGPETITVGTSASNSGNFVAGTYRYWVHLYYGGPSFTGSGAVLTMFQCNQQVEQWSVSNATGNPVGAIWQVVKFTIDANGEITAITPIQEFYAASQGGDGAGVVPSTP